MLSVYVRVTLFRQVMKEGIYSINNIIHVWSAAKRARMISVANAAKQRRFVKYFSLTVDLNNLEKWHAYQTYIYRERQAFRTRNLHDSVTAKNPYSSGADNIQHRSCILYSASLESFETKSYSR